MCACVFAYVVRQVNVKKLFKMSLTRELKRNDVKFVLDRWPDKGKLRGNRCSV